MIQFGCECGCGTATRRGVLRAALVGAAAGATEARAQAPVRAIDIHAHYFPEPYLELVGRSPGGAYVKEADGFRVGAPGLPPTALLPTKFTNLAERLAEMDAQGVAVHALSLSPPMLYWAEPANAEALARAWNDATMAACAQHPTRFVGLAALPWQDTERALRELERVRGMPAMRGVYAGTNINGRDLSAPEFLPIFKAIEAAGLPLFLHPLQTVGGARMAFYMGNFIGNPVDTAIAAGHLIFGGVLDACPRLEVNLPHAGGVLPILIGRFDHGSARRPETRHMAGRKPSDYLRRFTYDTIAHSTEIMRFVIGLVGADRVMLGTDYCYDMGVERPVEFIDTLGLNPEQRALVLGGTAARLLRI